ncbi:hypothetical protein BD769DRAFT_1640576 [Suillus cothurnatus]|nr:hypothetical protein BD769DRAFT_1640576 [Suillus cothurnatus]
MALYFVGLLIVKKYLDPEKAATIHPALTMDKWAYLWINLKRPVMIMTRSLICFILSLCMALILSTYTQISIWTCITPASGELYIGIGVGFLSATLIGTIICDKAYLYVRQDMFQLSCVSSSTSTIQLAAKNGGMVYVSWYAQAEVNFVPIVGGDILAFGMMTALYTASAIAATSASAVPTTMLSFTSTS